MEDPDVDLASDGGEREQSDDTPAHLKLGGPMPFDDLVKMRDEISFNIQCVTPETLERVRYEDVNQSGKRANSAISGSCEATFVRSISALQ